MRISKTILALLATAAVLPAADEVKPAKADAAPAAAAASSVKLDTQNSKAAYVIGCNIARNIKRDIADIDVTALVAGLQDVLSGKTPAIADADAMKVMEEFQKEMQAKQEKAAGEAGEKNAKAGDEFLAKNGKREGVTTTASGLQYEVIKKGDGAKPKATETVKVHYHGTLIDGTVFDSSVKRGEPATFGVNQVIPGWVEALQLMPVGSKWKLFIPSKLAYGERGAGNDIGPNSALVFEVELLGIEK